MVLPPVEKTPVVLLRWTEKALQQQNSEQNSVIDRVKNLLQEHQIVVLPGTSRDTLLLTATQSSLEEQAERDHLVKPRRVFKWKTKSTTSNLKTEHASDSVEIIRDHFQKAPKYRKDFCFPSNGSPTSPSYFDQDGLFSEHERCLLVLGLLERIIVEDSTLLSLLLQSHASPLEHIASTIFHDNNNNRHLRYILQSKEWIDILTPLHLDPLKLHLQKTTFYPLVRMMPPVDDILHYYGPTIAYYFAFMGFLGNWLLALGVLGLSSFLFRSYRNDTIDEDEYTPFYGLFCFLWAILLYRYWEQTEHQLAYRWGTLDITRTVDEFERDLSFGEPGGLYAHRRPEFEGWTRISPVTELPELYYPQWRRKLQYLFSAIVTSLMLAVAFCVMILSLNLQGYIQPKNRYHPFYFVDFAVLSEEGAWFDAKSNIKCYIPVVLHVVCILTLNAIYRTVARKLTAWENHETQTAHDNSLILKRFLFEAFDCYIVLFYLAFYERDVDRLRIELVAVFNIDSFRRLATEILLPYLWHWATIGSKGKSDQEHPHDLHLDEYEQFDDYMEILIQFGYVTLFASAYPMASLVMAGAVWVEIRSDMYKLTNLCQKPLAGERIYDIGVWKSILHFLVWFSCLTNCLLFGFTSHQMMHYMPHFYIQDSEGESHLVHDKGWLAILIIFGLERVLIIVGLIMHAMIPVVPESLVIQLKRRQYLLSRQDLKKD